MSFNRENRMIHQPDRLAEIFMKTFQIKLLTESSTFECSEFAKCHLSARELLVLNSVLNSEFLIGKFSVVSLKDHLRL